MMKRKIEPRKFLLNFFAIFFRKFNKNTLTNSE